MKKFRNTGNVIARRRFNADVAISLIKESINKESLFTRAACFWRLPRLRLAMTFSTLTFVLCLGLVSEARAVCNGATATTAGTDEDGAYCGSWDCGAEGSNVTCTLSKGTLTISGEGDMRNYTATRNSGYPNFWKSDAPWSGKMVTKAVVGGNVTKIGVSAFVGETYLTEISGMESVTSIGRDAFNRAGLTSIDIPNVTEIGYGAFHKAPNLQYINMRDDVFLGADFFNGYNGVFTNVEIAKSCVTANGYMSCGSCGAKVVQSGVGCVSDCYAGYTSYYGYCLRTRYTLPEADAATSNDNENMIEWIFE
ncbi:MAG: leucine-rich repeat protein [Alphaproteobacteria bacterium]|nr:leucine-rich repeat protein [Alphaproteobacteria bacterium]